MTVDRVGEIPDMDPKVKEVLDLLVEAHNKFCNLPQGNFSSHWMLSMNNLQAMMYMRHLAKIYPD